MKIILIGFMGAGKSTIAKKLGQSCKLPVLEMDKAVLNKTGVASMHDVFARGGEMLLRATEAEIARQCVDAESLIISTGAGAVLNQTVIDYLKAGKAVTIFLKASFQTIAKRLVRNQNRPLFKNLQDAKALYDFRLPLYLKYADHVVEVDGKSVRMIAEEIMLLEKK
jgi:shikimate kinase